MALSPQEQQTASYMTHELRAPLTSVRSALGLLQEQLQDRLSRDEKQVLDLAVKNANRLAGLINDILDFSKIQAGKMRLRAEPTDCRLLLQEAWGSLQAWAISKGIRLVRLRGQAPMPRVQADSKRTLQVLVNLVSNAIKFTPAGGKIELSTALGSGEHEGTVVFSVKDTGCGIAPEDLSRIFHCFEQSAAGVKASEGTGLGLTLAKAMVELQGGRIWAESWKGVGATFRFTLPIAREDQSRPVVVYPKPAEYHGALFSLFRRLNAFLATFF